MRSITICLLLFMALTVEAKTVLVLGDSLSAGYGLKKGQGWVELRQQRAPKHQIINASISGETSAGGAARLAPLLRQHRPQLLLLELGANDGLRGLSLKEMERNLGNIIVQSQLQGAKVILIGMQLPPNYGRRYASKFHAIYQRLVEQHQTGWVPFLMQGVALDPSMRLPDNLHPNGPAQPIILQTVWHELGPLLQ